MTRDARRLAPSLGLALLLVAEAVRVGAVTPVTMAATAALVVAFAASGTPLRDGATGPRLVRPAAERHATTLLALTGAVAYALGAAAPDPDRYLLLLVLGMLSAANLHTLNMQLAYQTAAAAAAGLVLAVSGMATATVIAGAGWVALFGGLGIWLGGGLRQATREATVARRQLDDHRRLLTAVAEINAFEPMVSAQSLVAAVRELGFEGAGLGVLRGDRFMPLAVQGASGERSPSIPLDGAVASAAFEADRPLVIDRYGDHPRALPEFAHYGGAILAPVAGRVTRGILVAARTEPGMPAPHVPDLVHALADLAAVTLDNAERMRLARERRRRLRLLDALVDDFLRRVSEDIRGPLTIARGAGQTLARYDRRLDDVNRSRMLEQLVTSSQTLDAMIADLLDFSRQPMADLGQLRRIDVAELLTRVAGRVRSSAHVPVAVAGDPAGEVETDVALVEFTVEAAVDRLLDDRRFDIRLSAATSPAGDLFVTVEVAAQPGALDGADARIRAALADADLEVRAVRSGVRLRFPRASVEVVT